MPIHRRTMTIEQMAQLQGSYNENRVSVLIEAKKRNEEKKEEFFEILKNDMEALNDKI